MSTPTVDCVRALQLNMNRHQDRRYSKCTKSGAHVLAAWQAFYEGPMFKTGQAEG